MLRSVSTSGSEAVGTSITCMIMCAGADVSSRLASIVFCTTSRPRCTYGLPEKCSMPESLNPSDRANPAHIAAPRRRIYAISHRVSASSATRCFPRRKRRAQADAGAMGTTSESPRRDLRWRCLQLRHQPTAIRLRHAGGRRLRPGDKHRLGERVGTSRSEALWRRALFNGIVRAIISPSRSCGTARLPAR